ncbi:MAG: hypothetical protein ABW321_08335 [Polyangiales bacterium]
MSRMRGHALVEPAAFVLVLGGLSYLLALNARRVFDFFDMSAFLDAGWRVVNGQRLYTDFFYTAGPLHPYAHALSFWLFGFTQQAVIAHLLFQVVLYCGSVWSIARKHLPLAATAVTVALAGLLFAGPISHPWYDQAALAYAAAGLALIDRAYRHVRPRRAALLLATAGLFMTASFCAKANVGVAALGIGGALACYDARSLRPALPYLLGVVVGGFLFLGTLASPAEFVFDAFIAYRPSARLGRYLHLVKTLMQPHTAWTLELMCIAVVLCFLQRNAAALRDALAALCCMALAVFMAWTGSAILSGNVFALGLPLVFSLRAVAQLVRDPLPAFKRQLLLAAACVYSLALGNIAIRTTQRLEIWTWHNYDPIGDYALHVPGFEGWRCLRAQCEPFDAVIAYLIQHAPRSQELLVFPESTWAYGLLGRTSFASAPFIFHVGQVPPPGAPMEKFQRGFTEHPPTWILLNHDSRADFAQADRLLDWLQLGAAFEHDYASVFRRGSYEVLRRNPHHQLTAVNP